MSLIPQQAVVTVTTIGPDFDDMPQKLSEALFPYPNARIVTMTQKSNWASPTKCHTSVLAVIEYDPPTGDR